MSPPSRRTHSTSTRRSANQRRGGIQRSLSEDKVVDAALALTVEVGLDKLTMAALAQRLEVGVMTLYSYFRSRSELLGAMAQSAVVALYDQHVDVEGVNWDEELRAHYHSIRESLKRHPPLADLLFYRSEMLPGSSEVRDRLAGHIRRHVDAMIRGGIEPSLAVRAFYGLSVLTLASTLREDDLKQSADYGVAAMAQYAGPFLQGVTPDVRFGSDDEYDTMLELVLRGLKATIDD
jgi:AcrR family transcriptional regulator